MIFLMTLYLQNVLGFSPLVTGLVFGVPGLAAMVAGVIAGRSSDATAAGGAGRGHVRAGPGDPSADLPRTDRVGARDR